LPLITVDAAHKGGGQDAVGKVANCAIMYIDSGDAATSWLIAYYDTITGFPKTLTNGMRLRFGKPGTNGWFKW
jgi:hypothetical protein